MNYKQIRQAVNAGRHAYNTMQNVRRYVPQKWGGTAGKRGRKYTSGDGLTTQHDRMLQYRKKRMPRRRRRRWTSFKRRVEWVINSQMGTQTSVFNGSGFSQTYTGATDQCWAAACLYGTNGEGATKLGWDDLFRMFSTTAGVPIASAGYEYHFKSAILDITISAVPNTGNAAPLEMDIYEVWCGRKGSRQNVGGDNAVNDITAGLSVTNTNPVGGTGTVALSMQQRGVTLFDMPNVISQQGWRIVKKTKVFLPAGGQTTYQIRDAREHVVDSANVTAQPGSSYQGFSTGGLTKFVLICAKPIIGYTSTPTANSALFQIGATRKYSYVINSQNARSSGYAP